MKELIAFTEYMYLISGVITAIAYIIYRRFKNVNSN